GSAGVPHEGGQRFHAHSLPAQTMQTWLSEGLRDDPADLPALKTITVLPGPRVLNEPSRWQQLAVLAQFADGRVRDVTRLTVFSSSDSAVADGGHTGLVEFRQAGGAGLLLPYPEEMQSG